MKSILSECIEKLRHSKQRYRRYLAVLLVLALCTTTGVSWGLRQNGISMTADYQCGIEEHEHTETCYSKTLICGQEEAEGVHQHTDACYEDTLICGKEAHQHTIDCMIDESADVETAAQWEAALPPELTGVWADDLISVAKSQIGYTESEHNFKLADDGTTQMHYTRYGAWYGNEYGSWSTMFAAFCLHYTGIAQETVPVNSGARAWMVDLQNAGLYQEAAFVPSVGDLVLLRTADGITDPDHAGIVSAIETREDGSIHKLALILGDDAGVVTEKTYVYDASLFTVTAEDGSGTAGTIIGYCDLPENPEKKDAPEAQLSQSAQTEHYSVTVSYGADVQIPAEAVLQVTEYSTDSEEYQNAVAQTEEEYDWLLDVGFYVNGEEIEPQAEISISVTELNADETSEEASEKKITHFAQSGVESVSGENKENTTTFSVSSLSLLGQVKNSGLVTVDVSLLSDTPVNMFYDIAEAAEQPSYKESSVSGVIEKNGVSIEGLEEGSTVGTVSDAATSNIEDEFTGTKDQDGKVRTDKSVTYGTDDYGAFQNYEDGTFGVTMSALGQEYNVTSDDSYKVPLDVVFVLDVSGSMRDRVSDNDSTRKRTAMVNAVNKAIDYIQKDNEQNRVGIALFSSASGKLLDLNRYTANRSGQYITAGNGDNSTLYTADGLRLEGSTRNIAQTYGGFSHNKGTYTQAGIEEGATLLTTESSTTAVVTTSKGIQKTVKRQPVIILLSDGVPTHGNHNYTNVRNTDASGNGSEDDNNKMIEGYYTILTANYYKSQIANHYANTAKFYTIGEGIDAISANSSDKDAYANAVLNPSADTMTKLNNKNGTWSSGIKKMLSQALDDGEDIYVGSYGNFAPEEYEYYYKAGIQKYTNYSYSDGSWFGKMSDTQLEAAFKTMINQSATLITYGFDLPASTHVTLSDPVGNGMEVKNDPVLRFGANNYTHSSKSESTDAAGNKVVTYGYNYTTTYAAAYPDNYNNSATANNGDHHKSTDTLDLSKIVVTVTTTPAGVQTVRMDVPEDLMPTVYPDDTQSFYYKETPVRLIYQVGLTPAAIAEVNALDDGASISYYTNQYQGSSASGTFQMTDENTYNFNEGSKNKSENASGTSETYFNGSESNNQVTQTLGNNGKITIKKGGTTNITVEKVWSDGADKHTNGSVTVNLIQIGSDGSTNETYQTVTLNAGNSWTHTWENLPMRSKDKTVTYTYKVKEDAVSGYKVRYTSEDVTGGTKWIITNIADNDVRLQVEKKWYESDGTTEITDTSGLPAINATLYQKDYKAGDNGVTLTVQAYYRYSNGNNPYYYTTTIGTYSVATGGSFSAEIGAYRNGTRRDIDSVTVTSGSATVSKSGDYGISVTNITANTTVRVNITDHRLSGAPTILSETHTQPDTSSSDQVNPIGTFTISSENDWQKFWTAADLNEQEGHTYSYWVEEMTVEGYITTIVYKDQDNALTPTEGNKTITVKNSKEPTYVLPKTGGAGTNLFTAGGIVLLGSALLYGYSLRRRRERRER